MPVNGELKLYFDSIEIAVEAFSKSGLHALIVPIPPLVDTD